MEEFVEPACQGGRHAVHCGQLFFRGVAHGVEGIEGFPECLAPFGADALNLVQDGNQVVFAQAFAMVCDGEAVRFVADMLDYVQGRRGLVQEDAVAPPFQENLLFPLGEADDLDVDAQAADDFQGRRKLPFAAVMMIRSGRSS